VRCDIRSDEATRALHGVDRLWHLGFQLWRGRGQAEVNLDGTAAVLAAAPGAIVLASSAAVYGAWPDNPLPIDESWTPRPNRQCPYAGQKLEVERRCAAAAPTAALRICAVLGPHADPRVVKATAALRRIVPAIRGRRQALQFLHEDDAVAALVGAAGAEGVFNIATDDWLGEGDVARVTAGRVLRIPRGMAIGLSELGYLARVVPFGADRAVLIDGPLALSSAKAAEELGWRASRRSGEVLQEVLAPAGQSTVR
jgi:nucleoside-diphosphate-sugar epimerase